MNRTYGHYLKQHLVQRGYAAEPLLETLSIHAIDSANDEQVLDGIVLPKQLLEIKAGYFGLDYVDLDGFSASHELLNLIGVDECYKLNILPLSLDNNLLRVASIDPLDVSLPQLLESKYGYRIELLLSLSSMLHKALKRSETESARLNSASVGLRSKEGREEVSAGKSELDNNEEYQQSPIAKFVNVLLAAALTKRASDIHIEPQAQGVVIKYRVDGVLYHATEAIDSNHHTAVVTRLKVMAELDIAESRAPQDGKFRIVLHGREVDFRLSVLPSVYGEDIVIRILDKAAISEEFESIGLDKLGMSDDVLLRFRRAVREPYGMVLMTGPTGSGKTTTLYAAIAEINDGEEKIVTIEDPVEYQLDGIVQIPVNEKKGLTFARGLRSILRHDPDKIMVGEIRDAETASIAVQSALTGHLVFTTVHANNVFDVVGRFHNMGIDIYSFVSSLNCVMAQRLVRLICTECKHEVTIDEELLELSGLNSAEYKETRWYQGAGCAHCNGTGYRGRAAVTEFLAVTPEIRQMFIEQRTLSEIKSVAIANGLITLRQSAVAKAVSGETTLKEVNRVTFVD